LVQQVKYGAHGEPEVQSASRARPGRRDGRGRVDSNGRS
jgi:hypothetical protein